MTSSLRRSLAGLCLLAPLASAVRAQHEGETAPAPAAKPANHTISVARQDTKSGPRWSMFCEDVPLDEALRTLAKKAGLALEGGELLPAGATVSVQLERRPIEQVLEFLLGSRGFSGTIERGTLRLAPPAADEAALLQRAQEAWRRVEAEGDERAASHARLAQGNLAEVRGDLEGAYRLYAELAAGELSDDAAQAAYRAGRILEKLGHWAEAAQHFRMLASADGARAFHSKARLELARVSIELGDADSALHLLNFLDENFRTGERGELAERRLVRAAAHNALHEYVEALRTLEEGEVVAAEEATARALEIRAEAFEGLGYLVEAARAWLIHAREAEGDARASAFERAAALALEAGDELGTLFICREAARAGSDERLGPLARQARTRLGLDQEDAPTSIFERLELAEARLAQGELATATQLFEGLYLARGALPESDQARVLAGWTQCMLDRTGLEPAIELLAKARADFQDPAAIARLDTAAAALLEAEELFDRAADAYRGIY